MKKCFDRIFITFLFLLIIALAPWIASASELATFKQLLADINDRLTHMQPSDENFPYQDIFTGKCEHPIELSDDGDLFREQSNQTGKIKGLELRGTYSTGTLTEDDEDESGLESGRANLELSWNILKQGYRQNVLRAKAQELQARAADLQQELEALADAHRCRRYKIKKEFTGMLTNLLDLKLRLMEPVYQIERRAYFKHWSFLDDYLVSEENLMLTRHELNTILSDSYYDDSPVYQSFPPIIEVDLAGILAAIRKDDRYENLFSVEKEKLRAEYAADLRDSLRIYLRKEFDVDSGGGENQDDFIAGLRFSVPLYSRKNKLLKLRIDRVEREKNNILINRIAQSRDAYTRMQEQLRRTIRQHFRQARATERLRRTLWLTEKDDEQSLATAITRMRTLIEARLELLRAKEELFRRVNEIFLVAEIPFSSDLVRSVSLQPKRMRVRFGARSIYIWSKDFNRINNRDLFAFLQAKQVSNVLLSAGRKTEVEKRDEFIEQATGNNITVELIIGDNNWIFRDNHERAVARSIIMAEKTGCLHFDIEPQAMSGYRENRQDYLSCFVSLIKKTKKGLMDRKLSIAVPFHWPVATYRELGFIADKLYVMAYGTTKPDVLIRRIKPILKTVPEDKTVIALRADDFTDEWAFEEMIEKIVTETTIENFAIQDLGSFIKKTASCYETED